MDGQVERYLDQVFDLARQHFSDLQMVARAVTDEWGLIQLRGNFRDLDIAITEVMRPTGRKYSYYLLKDGRVLLGLDNSPDRKALRLKFGETFSQHLYELVPHQHAEDKLNLKLTEEQTLEDFVNAVIAFAK